MLSLRPRKLAFVVALFAGTAPVALTGCPALLSWGLPAQGGNDATSAAEGGDSGDEVLETGGDAGQQGDAPSCNGLCVPTFGSGWAGPWIVTEQEAGTKMVEVCADGGAPTVVYGGLTAGPTDCSSCMCNRASGGGCSQPAITVYPVNGSASCGAGTGGNTPVNVGMGCTPVAMAKGDSFTITSSPLAGSCGPTTVTPGGLPLAVIGTVAAACATNLPVGPCGSGGTCYAALPPGSALCVAQDGSAPQCPAGFPNLRVYGNTADLADTRSCSTCSCDPVPGSCTGAVDLYADADCTNEIGQMPVALPAGCAATETAAASALDIGQLALGPSSCQMSGQLSGVVTFANPVTYCCL